MKTQELKKIFLEHSEVLQCSKDLNDTYLNFEGFKRILIIMHDEYNLEFTEITDNKDYTAKTKRLKAELRNKKVKEKFIKELERLYRINPQWQPDIVKRFWQYWTEWDSLKPEKGLRFEKHDQFNIKRRMTTFIKNQKKFDKQDSDRV